MTSLPILKSLRVFLLEAPLYQSYKLNDDLVVLSHIYGKTKMDPFDGFCINCNTSTIYKLSDTANIPNGKPWDNIESYVDFGEITIECCRKSHPVKFYFQLSDMEILKIGQYPSYADIENGKIKILRQNMLKIDSSEVYKAIGLAAHGIGIGSFVYLRRILERLIMARFDEFKDLRKWNEMEFKNKSMSEKIYFLKDHLPIFLVNNSKIYSILSLGIHELDEGKCLGAFEVLKKTVIYILRDDIQKKEELKLRKELESEIASYPK